MATNQLNKTAVNKTQILYDGDCPICQRFAANVKQSKPSHQLINAREDSTLKTWVTHRGLDIDKGLVVIRDRQVFYGAEAVCAIAREVVTQDSPPLWAYVLQSSARCRVVYPLLTLVRRLILLFTGKSLINHG